MKEIIGGCNKHALNFDIFRTIHLLVHVQNLFNML